MPHTRVLLGMLPLLIVLMGACGGSRGPPAPGATPSRVCWTLQRTIDGLVATADTGFVPSRFAFEVTPAGVIVARGTRIRGRWSMVTADSVHAEWEEGRRRVWLFGSARQDRFVGSGHVFTWVGASVLVRYTGVRVRCDPNP